MFKRYPLSRYTLLLVVAALGVLLAACAAPAAPAPQTGAQVPALPSLEATTVPPAANTPAPTTPPEVTPTEAPATTVPTVAPTAAPTVAPTPVAISATIGVAEQVADLQILPQQVTRASQLGTNKPKSGDTYLVVTISLTNTSQTDDVQFDPATFVINDATANKTYPAATLTAQTDELTAQTLKPGAKLDGKLIFEVPQATADKLELELSTATHIVYWTIGA